MIKVVVPFYPLYVPTEKEDYFKICSDAGSGEIVSLNQYGILGTIKKIKGKVVHGHGRVFPLPMLSFLFAKKSIYTFHNNFIGKKWYAKLIRRFIFNRYDYITVHTEYAKQNYIKDGIKKEKIRVLPNPVDYEFFSKPEGGEKFREKYGIKENEFFAISVGTISYRNPHIIAEACKRAGIRVVIVGFINKEEVKKFPGIKPYVNSLKSMDNVILTGFLNKEELLSAYDAASVYINSSNEIGENFGIAVYEAASAGIPLCLPDYGIFDVFEKCALFHNCYDIEQLTENIKRYIKDENLRKKNIENARKVAAMFNYEIVYEKYKRFYMEVGIL